MGVKQDCDATNTVQHDNFALLMDASCDYTGFPIRYRFDGKLFDLARLQANTKVQTDVQDELRYVDDMDENANSEAK